MISKGRLYRTLGLEFVLFDLHLSPFGLWESLKEHFVPQGGALSLLSPRERSEAISLIERKAEIASSSR